MVRMIACSDTDVSRTISLWIHSLPPRKGVGPPVGTCAANSLLQTKDSYMLCQCNRNQKSFKRLYSLPRKLGHPPQSLQKCPVNIGTTLRALEEGTPWSNKAELYIGLIKEAVRKDMHESNSLMSLWDYCME